jgi:hypothetical protein
MICKNFRHIVISSLYCKFIAMLMFVATTHLHAGNISKPVSVWAFSIYGVEITQNYLAPFFEDIFQAIGRPYTIVYGNEIARLQSNCTADQHDIIFASYGLEMRNFERNCNYQAVALTDQDINIYVRSHTSPYNVKSLALIKGMRAGDVSIIGDKELLYFNSHASAVLAMYRGEVDGMVSSAAGVKRLLPVLGKQLKIVFTFAEKGHAVVLMSASYYASASGQKFRSILLENRPKSIEVFVEGIGLGKWREL